MQYNMYYHKDDNMYAKLLPETIQSKFILNVPTCIAVKCFQVRNWLGPDNLPIGCLLTFMP